MDMRQLSYKGFVKFHEAVNKAVNDEGVKREIKETVKRKLKDNKMHKLERKIL